MSRHRENAKILKRIPFPTFGRSLTAQDQAFKAKSTWLRRQECETERGRNFHLEERMDREPSVNRTDMSFLTMVSTSTVQGSGPPVRSLQANAFSKCLKLDCRNQLQGDKNVLTTKYVFSIFIWTSDRMLVQISISNQIFPNLTFLP